MPTGIYIRSESEQKRLKVLGHIIGSSTRGKKRERFSFDHIEKIRNAGIGRIQELHNSWKGDQAGKAAIRVWLNKYYGKATKCENINCKHKSICYVWVNISGKPKRNISDYRQLCMSCLNHYRGNTGRKVLHHPMLNKTKRVNSEHILEYLVNGWVLGHSKKSLEHSLKSNCKNPNKFETKALAYVNSIYNNKVKYTGDGSFIQNGKSADAILKNAKIVFLFNGIYWHLTRFGFGVTEEAKRIVEAKESEPFVSTGYKVIFIWEDELKHTI